MTAWLDGKALEGEDDAGVGVTNELLLPLYDPEAVVVGAGDGRGCGCCCGTKYALHALQNTWPHSRQWCRRRNTVNGTSQL
jgi:hypothetical protein